MNKREKAALVAENKVRLPDLTADALMEIGQALSGRHWQADVARETFISKSQVTRYITEERFPDVGFGKKLNRFLVDKIEDVVPYIGDPTFSQLSKADQASIGKAKKLIYQGIGILRRYYPAVKRTKILPETPRKRAKVK